MREGGLEPPIRHNIAWQDEEYYDEEKLDDELRRVFDVCHSCRRCFNLCDSFPRLFDLIDESTTGELDSVDSKDFKPIVDACTLCDMCFMVSCPYVPPHEFDLDFAHLMLRHRAVEYKNGEVPFAKKQLAKTDRNGKLGTAFTAITNWTTENTLARAALDKVAGIDPKAKLPKYAGQSLEKRAKKQQLEINQNAPGYGEHVLIYATCFGNYNEIETGDKLRKILAKNGITSEVHHPSCCGMPEFENGNLKQVSSNAEKVAEYFKPYIEQGRKIIALVPSCALMVKFEWPLLLPEDGDVKKLSEATYDMAEYIVSLAEDKGIADGMSPLKGGVTIHVPCHARAQNIGAQAVKMLKIIPGTPVKVIERCSGHGGTWGIMKENHSTALKIGKPVARQAVKFEQDSAYVVSECPLAADHILQGMEEIGTQTEHIYNPIELIAEAYNL
jgi:glycerol-3-phosphate dehydrogenase subunit C